MSKTTFVQHLIIAFMCLTGFVVAQDDNAEKVKDDELTAKRYQLMQKRMAAATARSSVDDFPDKFEEKPIFRYTDPARNYVAAAVWKLGATGRPRAIITTELHRQYAGQRRIVYEYLALSPDKFWVTGGDLGWAPEGAAIEFKPVPDSAAPEETPVRRLLQMRAIAKRVTGEEIVGKERCELRLLSQPVDRYTPSATDRADGAIFIAAFGTNPEAVLFIESNGKAWNYAVGRLSGAQSISLSIDGTKAWEGTPVRYGRNSPYTASNAPADIPGIADDGTEIQE